MSSSITQGGGAACLAIAAILALAACGGGSSGSGASSATPAAAPPASTLSQIAQLGEQIFRDTSLSASGRMACATCHDPANAHAPANDLAVQLGGPSLDRAGTRQAPSIRYLRFSSNFHFAADGTPTGGFFWDGRADSLRAQANEPFLNEAEMALPSKAAVVEKLRLAPYAPDFLRAFGDGIFANPEIAFERMTFALAQYQKEDADFVAFTSKYDAFLNGRATLSEAELRGLALFTDRDKGNCASCHPSTRRGDGTPPLFTDFTYDTLGVPRNPEIAANADPAYYDLGLCARPSGDLASRPELCGAFKVPSLRNVGERRRFFHNGRFKSLKEALQFYVQRDTHPEKWYPTVNGAVLKFDDLPPQYRRNVNRKEVPYNRNVGDAPALDDAQIDDLLAFLKTLSDGYVR